LNQIKAVVRQPARKDIVQSLDSAGAAFVGEVR
jgi:hypothetical protein